MSLLLAIALWYLIAQHLDQLPSSDGYPFDGERTPTGETVPAKNDF